MGRVYEGRQCVLDRPVAIKCVHPHLLSSDPMVVRFMEEARVASRLVHPNIVKIYDFGRTDVDGSATLFLVMELLSGPDLGSVIRSNAPLSVSRIGAISRQMLSALGEAHARGITHRDAKPENVILEPVLGGGERVKIIDFGIACVHGVPGLTSAGNFMGTPHYMAPEQIRGERAEVSADLYAVGVTLFQMLTGELPFQGDSVTRVLEKQLYGPRPDPRDTARGRNCPAGLAHVCRKALAVDPEERYATADSLAEAVEEALSESLPSRTRRTPLPPPASSDEVSGISASPYAATAESSVPPPPSGMRLSELRTLERLERSVDDRIAEGRLHAAIPELERALELGERFDDLGEPELASAVVTAFGRKLGAVLRDLGRLPEADSVLRMALSRASGPELARARILAELATTAAARGRATEAEAHRLEALRIAGAHGDRELTVRLRRLAQSLALAALSRSALADGGGDSPPPRLSEMRFRGPEDQSDGAPARRRR
jgi:serine/threonine-protein kinase